jgi:hypothetical protein
MDVNIGRACCSLNTYQSINFFNPANIIRKTFEVENQRESLSYIASIMPQSKTKDAGAPIKVNGSSSTGVSRSVVPTT